MAQIRIKETTLTGALNSMVNNVGSARTDEFYFQTNDITIDDVYDRAFAKKLLVTITNVNSNIYKLQFSALIT